MSDSWYDYPQYYEWAFADETRPEADFLEQVFAQFAVGPVRKVLEPGCGGGRLTLELARRGFAVTAFDNNQPSLDYFRQRLQKAGLTADVGQGDLVHFKAAQPVDAVLCTFNTFRHLLSEEDALAHLRSAAASLRPGGLYVLGFHLMPPDAAEECIERWRAKRGQTAVSYTLRVLSFNRRQRRERLRVSMLVRTPKKTLRLASEFDFRLYTAAQFRQLIGKVADQLELLATFDFRYEIEHPVKLDNELSDAVFIFRRR